MRSRNHMLDLSLTGFDRTCLALAASTFDPVRNGWNCCGGAVDARSSTNRASHDWDTTPFQQFQR
jgi:hypothetical protein